MSSANTQKMQVSCPQCTQPLMVPLSAAGRTGRCPSCGFTFTLLEQAAAAPSGFPDPVPESAEQSRFPAIQTESVAEKVRRAAAADEGGAFAPEKKGLQAGVAGGLLMMVIAVVWFFGGLALGRIFFYPPVLFIFGLVGFIKGLATGNIAGGKRRY